MKLSKQFLDFVNSSIATYSTYVRSQSIYPEALDDFFVNSLAYELTAQDLAIYLKTINRKGGIQKKLS